MATITKQNQNAEILPNRYSIHLARKGWHMFTGGPIITAYFLTDLGINFWVYLTLAIGVFGLVSDLIRFKSPAFNRLIFKALGPFLRSEEKHSFSGLPFYALGCCFSLYFFPERIAILSILFLIFSDPISSLFGIMYGRDKLIGNKSIQGSVAGFCVCYIVSLLYGMTFAVSDLNLLSFSLVAGLIGSFSEILSVFGIDDNLTIPVVSGLGLTIINYVFQIY